jgi:neutral amino acid transport system permease protein
MGRDLVFRMPVLSEETPGGNPVKANRLLSIVTKSEAVSKVKSDCFLEGFGMVDYLLTYLAAKDYLLFLVTSVAIYSLFSLGLNLHWGFTGLLNFGHAGFMAIGAYTTVLLTLAGCPWFISAILGGLASAILGLIMGFSTLKLREDYLAIVTIGVSEVVRIIIRSREAQPITGGTLGIQGFPLPLEGFLPTAATRYGMMAIFSLVVGFGFWRLGRSLLKSFRRGKPLGMILAILGAPLGFYLWFVCLESLDHFKEKPVQTGLMFLSVITLALVFVALQVLVKSPWGRILKAIREDEEVVKALGKNVFAYKLQSLMLGGFIAGLGAAFSAWQLSNVYPTNFSTDLTFNTWTIVVLGGAGSNPGTLLGAAIFWVYSALTRDLDRFFPVGFPSDKIGALRIMLIGLILMLLMIWRPQGILGNKDELTLGK